MIYRPVLSKYASCRHKLRKPSLDEAYCQAVTYFYGLKDHELLRYVLVSDLARLAQQREAQLVGEFCDIESGKQDRRPELFKAIDYAKPYQAHLVIAKLDRLSRNMTFVSSLMDSHVSFMCADMPDANEFTIHIFAAFAQQERKLISERTKKALDEKLLRIGQWHRSGRVFQDPLVSAKAA